MTDKPTPPPLDYRSPGTSNPNGPRETYNTITDTLAGPNIRLRDNLYQGAFILVFTVLCAGVGYFLTTGEPMAGILIGALIGLIGGVLISGIFLMIYRAVRHARGKHD